MAAPLAIAAIGSAVGSTLKSIPRPVWIALLLAGGATGVYFLGRKVYRQVRQDNASQAFGSDTATGRAVEAATAFYNAIITSGKEWLNDSIGDGTDEETLFVLAQRIANDPSLTFPMVRDSYRKLFNRDLVLDLTRDLDAEEMNKLQNVLGGLGRIGQLLSGLNQTQPQTIKI